MADPSNPAAPGPRCSRCGGPEHEGGRRCPADTGPGRTLAYGDGEDPLAPQVDPLIGARVGSFRIVRMVGRGGMGTVYLAEHPVIGSKVAIKFLHGSHGRTSRRWWRASTTRPGR